MIICISGLPGSGKTTIANLIEKHCVSNHYSVNRLNSDTVADRIFIQKYFNSINRDIDYSAEELQTIYNTLFYVIEQILVTNPRTIIITDGMYRKTSQRLVLDIIAQKLGIDYVLIKTEVVPYIAKNRLIKRNKEGGLGGWVDPTIYEQPSGNEIIIENKGSLKQLENRVDKVITKLFNS